MHYIIMVKWNKKKSPYCFFCLPKTFVKVVK